jgi:hypothetical protein
MKKFAILSIASLMTLSAAHAEQPSQYFAIGHKMMTFDLDLDLGDVDITGTQLTYGKRVHEKVIVEGNLVTFYKFETDDADLEISSIDISGLFYPLNNQFHVR